MQSDVWGNMKRYAAITLRRIVRVTLTLTLTCDMRMMCDVCMLRVAAANGRWPRAAPLCRMFSEVPNSQKDVTLQRFPAGGVCEPRNRSSRNETSIAGFFEPIRSVPAPPGEKTQRLAEIHVETPPVLWPC